MKRIERNGEVRIRTKYPTIRFLKAVRKELWWTNEPELVINWYLPGNEQNVCFACSELSCYVMRWHIICPKVLCMHKIHCHTEWITSAFVNLSKGIQNDSKTMSKLTCYTENSHTLAISWANAWRTGPAYVQRMSFVCIRRHMLKFVRIDIVMNKFSFALTRSRTLSYTPCDEKFYACMKILDECQRTSNTQ